MGWWVVKTGRNIENLNKDSRRKKMKAETKIPKSCFAYNCTILHQLAFSYLMSSDQFFFQHKLEKANPSAVLESSDINYRSASRYVEQGWPLTCAPGKVQGSMVYFWKGLDSLWFRWEKTPAPAMPRMDSRRQMGTGFGEMYGQISSFLLLSESPLLPTLLTDRMGLSRRKSRWPWLGWVQITDWGSAIGSWDPGVSGLRWGSTVTVLPTRLPSPAPWRRARPDPPQRPRSRQPVLAGKGENQAYVMQTRFQLCSL